MSAILFNQKSNCWELNGLGFFDPDKTFSRSNRLHAKEKESGRALHVRRAESRRARKILDDRALGELVGFCTGNGITWITFGNGVTVSVNYISKALAFKARHGWFLDHTQNTEDHSFSGNIPTPGGNWGEGRRLLAEAAELKKAAGLAHVAHAPDADELDQSATALTERAEQLLYSRR